MVCVCRCAPFTLDTTQSLSSGVEYFNQRLPSHGYNHHVALSHPQFFWGQWEQGQKFDPFPYLKDRGYRDVSQLNYVETKNWKSYGMMIFTLGIYYPKYIILNFWSDKELEKPFPKETVEGHTLE